MKHEMHHAASLIPPGARLAIYEAYLASLPLYLKIAQPIMGVSSRAKHRIMTRKPSPTPGH